MSRDNDPSYVARLGMPEAETTLLAYRSGSRVEAAPTGLAAGLARLAEQQERQAAQLAALSERMARCETWLAIALNERPAALRKDED